MSDTASKIRKLRRLIPHLASELQTPGADIQRVSRRLAIALRDYQQLDPGSNAYVTLHRHHLLHTLIKALHQAPMESLGQ